MTDLPANDILFGSDPTPGILAVEPGPDDRMIIYRRERPDAPAAASEEPFTPFLWCAGPSGLEGVRETALGGGLALDTLVEFESWAAFERARQSLRTSGRPHLALNDPVQQYLTLTGRTLFKGMERGDLRRLQLDIETWCDEGYEFSNAARAADHITAIALSDNSGWEEFLVADPADPDASEKAMLAALTRIVRERDPDIIEGHNLFKFDLPYLAARARRHKLRLAWGRDGGVMRSRPSRLQIAERTIQHTRFEIPGRHIVDTYLLVQFYDVTNRELESFGLKEVARHFGVSGGDGAGDRVTLRGTEIQRAWKEDPARFREYALQDVRETRAVADLLGRSYFLQAQIFPFAYQNVILRGNATRIDALFLREYLRRGHSLPDLPEPQPFEGGYTDIFVTGVVRGVWHCDVTSLYPSVMLEFGIGPAADRLGVFRAMLEDLRRFRVDAKKRLLALGPGDAAARAALDALQGTFKILINSFYGYLGFAQGHFADFAAAAQVTERGRAILRQMVDWLRGRGAEVIEIDTDGIYFHPPDGVSREELDAGLEAVLPPGIEVGFDAEYRAMFSYKAKNYALLEMGGGVILKGGALKSRGLEKYLREFLEGMVRHLLEGTPERVPELLDSMRAALRGREWPIDRLAKTEALQDSLEVYRRKIGGSARNRSAAYEIALRSGRAYGPGDQISYYITGTKKRVAAWENSRPVSEWDPAQRDENVEYYVAKLDDLAEKFAAYFDRQLL